MARELRSERNIGKIKTRLLYFCLDFQLVLEQICNKDAVIWPGHKCGALGTSPKGHLAAVPDISAAVEVEGRLVNVP